MKKRKKWIIFLIVLFVIGIIPIPLARHDGGTVEYCAVFYKVIVWKVLYEDSDGEVKLHRGTNFYFFPNNFSAREWETR